MHSLEAYPYEGAVHGSRPPPQSPRYFLTASPKVARPRKVALIGWAGWDAHQRALVLLDLLEADAHAQRPDSALPLLAALAELLPWVRTRHGLAPASPQDADEALSHAYEHHVTRLGLSAEDVSSWRPPGPRRGRPRRGDQGSLHSSHTTK